MEKKTQLRLARRGLKRPRPPTRLRQAAAAAAADQEGQDSNDLFVASRRQWQPPPTLRVPRAPRAAAAEVQRQQGCWGERAGDAAAAVDGSSATAGARASSSCRGGAADAHAARRSHTCGPRTKSAGCGRRQRRAATTRTLATTALALTLVGVASAGAGASTLFSEQQQQQQQQQHRQARSSTTALSSRLCSPPEGSRAYVTTIADNGGGSGSGGRGKGGTDRSGDRLLGARVLAQSLRSAGAKGEVVVLVPRDRANTATVDSLRRDGLTVQVVPRGPESGGGEIVSEELMTKVFLWSLTSYDRVVFLDPRSLIQKNPDALFACEGFCAAGAVYSPSSSPSFRPSWAREADAAAAAVGAAAADAPPLGLAHGVEDSGGDDDDDDDEEAAAAAAAVLEKPLSAPASWQPSTSVMVLEPSLEVHAAMLDELTRTQSASSLEAQVFLSSFLIKGASADAGERCTPFEDPLENAASDLRRNGGERGDEGEGNNVLWGSGDAEENDFGGGGGSFLEDALMPVVLLNGPHLPRCAAGRKRTAEGVCQRLPYTFAAPSTDFTGKGTWGVQGDEGNPEPHIVHFADEDTPWKRLEYLHKPLLMKWNAYREQLEYPYGNFFAPWVLFFIPCVVLAFARMYYKTTSGSRGDRNRACGGGGEGVLSSTTPDGCSPSKRRAPWLRSPTRAAAQRQQVVQQVAILPACGMAAAYDGAASAGVGSLEAPPAARLRSCAGGAAGGGVGIAVGADQSPSSCLSGRGSQRLPVRVCYLLSAVVGGLGLLWFRAARALAREVVDSSWHPVISVSVHDAWLCSALVLGLYVMDYLYYALLTRGRTLLKDSVAVVLLVATVRVLHSMTTASEGSSGGTGVVWASAIGVGVIALGFGHGSRAGVVHHLSGRAHFRCVTASCVIGTVVSMTVCCAGPKMHQFASRRAQSAAATVQMVFVALVYASVIGGARLRCDADDGGSKIGRSCSTASFVSEALMATAPGKGMTPSVSLNALSTQEARATATAGTAAWAMEGLPGGGGGGGEQGWKSAWSLLAKAAAWTRDLIWQRPSVAALIVALGLWTASSAIWRPTTPSRRFEMYGQSCLESKAGYVEAGGKRLSRVCGVEQALRPVATGAYFEAFRQDKMCLEVAGGGFLTLGRVHVAPACVPENQFVLQEVVSAKSSTAKAHGRAASSSTADNGMYCLYNPTSGLYLSAQGRPRAQCGSMEHWRVKPAPRAPGLTGGGGGGGAEFGRTGSSKTTLSALLHPSFLSRGPLHTFYGYLLVATALLVARAVFSKLAASSCALAAGRGGSGGTSSGSGGGGGLKYHRGLGTRQRSRGRTHSRSRSSFGNVADTAVHLADAGYAGDAETGGVGYGTGGGGGSGGGGSGGNCSGSSSGSRVRSSQQVQFGGISPSVSPVGDGSRQRDSIGWTAEAMMAATRGDDRQKRFLAQGGGGGGSGRFTRPHVRRETSSGAASASTAAAPAACGWLPKLFSGLVVVCDATLLAGLWCLIPAHFAQALSALTLDHHSAIDQGLGMDSNANAAPADNGWSRGLGEGVHAPAEYAILVDGGGNGSGGDELGAMGACEHGAWWLMSALIRWHLLLVVLAFCHLHAAVNAASSAASAHRWRHRRPGKRVKAPAGGHDHHSHHHRCSGSFWGLRSGDRLAMRLRTALSVLTLLCAAAAAAAPELSELTGLPFTRLHAHPGWGRCAPGSGLGDSWGAVSPVLVFAMLAATGGVYLRAGSSFAVRCGAGVALLAAGGVVAAAAGREYLALAVTALAMDWLAWTFAGLLSCVCYLSECDDGGLGSCPPEAPQLGKQDSSGSAGSSGDLTGGGGGVGDQPRAGNSSSATGEGRGARQRITDAARRISPSGWVVGLRGRRGGGGDGGRVGFV